MLILESKLSLGLVKYNVTANHQVYDLFRSWLPSIPTPAVVLGSSSDMLTEA